MSIEKLGSYYFEPKQEMDNRVVDGLLQSANKCFESNGGKSGRLPPHIALEIADSSFALARAGKLGPSLVLFGLALTGVRELEPESTDRIIGVCLKTFELICFERSNENSPKPEGQMLAMYANQARTFPSPVHKALALAAVDNFFDAPIARMQAIEIARNIENKQIQATVSVRINNSDSIESALKYADTVSDEQGDEIRASLAFAHIERGHYDDALTVAKTFKDAGLGFDFMCSTARILQNLLKEHQDNWALLNQYYNLTIESCAELLDKCYDYFWKVGAYKRLYVLTGNHSFIDLAIQIVETMSETDRFRGYKILADEK